LLDELQAKLAITGAPAVREALAANPRLNEKRQSHLATVGNSSVKSKLAENPSLINAIQSMLVDDQDWSIRRSLARNPSLDIDLQTKLMKDQDIDVRIALASNPILTSELQQQILSKRDREVVVALAANPSLSLEQQAEFTNTGSFDERLSLYGNPSLDESLKKRVIASFSQYDLSSMERDIENKKRRMEQLESEKNKVYESLDRPSLRGVFFFLHNMVTDEIEVGYDEVNRIDRRIRETNIEIYDLHSKIIILKDILNSQTA
jgi:hypothetical protein